MKTRRGSRLAPTACTLVLLDSLLLLSHGTARAQANSDTGDEHTGLEEVVVSAQRREENIQSVGISVTALSGEELSARGTMDSTQIANMVPALKFNQYSPSTTVYNLRGVSQNDYSDHLEPPVAVYQDDAYVSSMAAAGFPLFDLERVEVLRGPQGTLFGRNATGGAIQYISRKPTDNLSANASATYFSDSGQSLEGGVGGPLNDTISMRVAGVWTQRDGYVKDRIVADHGEIDQYAGRAHLLWKPNQDVSLLLSTRYGRDDSSAGGGYAYTPAVPGFHGLGVLQGADEDFWGSGPGRDAGGYSRPANLGQYTIESNTPSFFERTLRGYSARLDWTLGAVQLIAISDYQKMDKVYQEDCDATPVTVCIFAPRTNSKQFSQEVRLEGQTDSLQWVAGVYYIDIDGNYGAHAEYNLPAHDYFFTGDSAYSIRTKSPSAFAQTEVSLTDQLKLTVGGRYTRDDKTDRYRLDGNTTFEGEPTQDVILFNPSLYPQLADRTFDLYSAKVQLDYSVNDDVLLYAGITRGTKSGNFSAPVSVPVVISSLPHDPELLYSYETGFKSTLLDDSLRFNAAVFYYDYNNYQAFNLQGLVQTIANLDARAYGGEIELTAVPVRGLTLSAGISYLRTKVLDVTLPDGVVVDRDLPQAPKFSGNATVEYTHEVGPGDLTARVDGYYSDEFCFSVFCGPVDREGAYGTVDASLSYRYDQLTITAFGKNLTDESYRVYGLDVSALGVLNSVLARPRYYGVTVSYEY